MINFDHVKWGYRFYKYGWTATLLFTGGWVVSAGALVVNEGIEWLFEETTEKVVEKVIEKATENSFITAVQTTHKFCETGLTASSCAITTGQYLQSYRII